MLKKIWKDPVGSKVIAAAILALFGLLGTYLAGWWPAVAGILSGAWSYVGASTSVPNWLLWPMAACVLVTVMLLTLKVLANVRQAGPTFESYTSDEIFGVRWRWRWVNGEFWELNSFCPRCDHQVFPKGVGYGRTVTGHECEDCGWKSEPFIGSAEDLHRRVVLKVQKNARTGGWRDRVAVQQRRMQIDEPRRAEPGEDEVRH